MTQLIIASALFFAIHIFVSGTGLRGKLVGAVGEKGFAALFSLASAVFIVWMAMSYNAAVISMENTIYWGGPYWAHWLAAILMIPASVFVVAALTTKNPTAVQQEDTIQQEEPAKGIVRITRHPMMIGFSIWALVHLLANGDLASIIFFGTFLLVAGAGMPSIDAKRKKVLGAEWDRFAQQTSIIPFAAILTGRQKLKIGEIGWAKIVGGLILYALLYHFHGWMFGMQPVLVTS